MFDYLLNSSGDWRTYIVSFLLTLPIILLSLTIHECAHGYVACKLGDRTASNLGRLTLDPRKHLDPVGFICMLLFGFGWAKPVPVNSRNFKKPRRDMALTALAGPVANLLLAFVFVILYLTEYAILKNITLTLTPGSTGFYFLTILSDFLYLGAMLNVYLAVFNMLPIPPFDGSRIFYIFLPTKWYFKVMEYERYIMIGLLILLWLGVLTLPLSLISHLIIKGMFWILELLPFFG